MSYTVTIHWGSETTRAETAPITYDFDSPEQRDAFLEGVDEACGWMDYEVVEDEPDEAQEENKA